MESIKGKSIMLKYYQLQNYNRENLQKLFMDAKEQFCDYLTFNEILEEFSLGSFYSIRDYGDGHGGEFYLRTMSYKTPINTDFFLFVKCNGEQMKFLIKKYNLQEMETK